MTNAEFTAWLKNPSAIRVVLIEANALVGGVETTFYMSTKGGYTTSPSDTPSNTFYHPVATVDVLYTEELSLSIDSAPMLSAGVITVSNHDGKRDTWLNHVWTNQRIKAWIGDQRWPRADFQPIFDGVLADISPNGRDKLSLKLRDKTQRLNTPITEQKLGGTTEQKDNLIPVTFGEVSNATPLLIDPATLTYKIHDGPIESIIEVRDNGIPVTATANLTNGTFTLAHQPFGNVTVSVQGDKHNTVYANKIGATIKRIVTGYGKASDRFTESDIDLDNFTAFDTANPQPVGWYIDSRTNVLECCHIIAGSVGAQIVPTRTGKLRLIRLAIPASGTPTEIREKHIVAGKLLTPVTRTEVQAAVKVGFNKNWTAQEDLTTSIPEAHKKLYKDEWLTTTAVDSTVQSTYKLDAEPEQEDTALLTRADAEAEATRRLNLWKVPRMVYEFEGVPELLSLELGQPITVYNRRFGMSNGVTGTVISLAPNWSNGHVTVRFIT